jgi:hypothetical protein
MGAYYTKKYNAWDIGWNRDPERPSPLKMCANFCASFISFPTDSGNFEHAGRLMHADARAMYPASESANVILGLYMYLACRVCQCHIGPLSCFLRLQWFTHHVFMNFEPHIVKCCWNYRPARLPGLGASDRIILCTSTSLYGDALVQSTKIEHGIESSRLPNRRNLPVAPVGYCWDFAHCWSDFDVHSLFWFHLVSAFKPTETRPSRRFTNPILFWKLKSVSGTSSRDRKTVILFSCGFDRWEHGRETVAALCASLNDGSLCAYETRQLIDFDILFLFGILVEKIFSFHKSFSVSER